MEKWKDYINVVDFLIVLVLHVFFFGFVLFFAYDSIENNVEGDQSISFQWFFSLPNISYLMLLFFLLF